MTAVPASINRTARLAGALYLTMAALGFFGILYVPSVLVVPGDAVTTARNIMASELLFRSGMVAHLMGQTIFIFLALALYRLLKPVNQHHATLMVILVLVSIPITFLNELNHLAALRLLRQAGTGGDTSAHLQTQAMLFLNLREDGILIAQIFWGLWLLPLGFLIFRSGFLPRLLGVLLMIGGTGYLVDVTTRLLATGLPTVSQFTFIGELLLPLWLLIRGVDLERWRDASANPRMEY